MLCSPRQRRLLSRWMQRRVEKKWDQRTSPRKHCRLKKVQCPRRSCPRRFLMSDMMRLVMSLHRRNLPTPKRLEVIMYTRSIPYPVILAIVFAISSASFVWSQDEAGSTIALGDVKTLEDLAQVGGQLFEGKGQCAQCHSLQEEPSNNGPTLEGVGAKLTREFLHESLVKPDAYAYLDFTKTPPAPYAAPMPPTALADSEILAVIAYLQQSSGQPISIELSELK
ncbi:MAG TPA: cytochrome c [Nitrospirales bacterium]|nr:cytochrome c [Nitrospirales bacterium]